MLVILILQLSWQEKGVYILANRYTSIRLIYDDHVKASLSPKHSSYICLDISHELRTPKMFSANCKRRY